MTAVKISITFVGEGGAAKIYNSTFHAIRTIVRQEGALKLYTGLVCLFMLNSL